MVQGPDSLALPKPAEIAVITRRLGLAEPVHVVAHEGGSNPVFAVELADGDRINIKTYGDLPGNAPQREAHAASLLAGVVPATRYLLVDESCSDLPWRFAVTTYLRGEPLTAGVEKGNATELFRQMGALLRRVHSVSMPAYGALDGSDGHSDNFTFVAGMADDALLRFRQQGGDRALADRLEKAQALSAPCIRHSAGPVFAHYDFHPGNILVDDGRVSGLIDFGNAVAADAVSDLAKALFCTEHMAPGASAPLLEGYGPIDHPDPAAALGHYTMIHRLSMWAWLRQIGEIAWGQHDKLIDDLQAMLA